MAEIRAEEKRIEIRERGIRHFLHDTCDISSTPVTEDESGPTEQSDDDFQAGGDTLIMTSRMTVVDQEIGQSEEPNSSDEPGFHLDEGHAGPVAIPESVAPYRWSSSWAQARAEAAQRQAEEERFSWMKEKDLHMLSLGLEPVPWEQFSEAINQTGDAIFQAIEQRTCEEQVFETGGEPGPESLVGATRHGSPWSRSLPATHHFRGFH
jgi:hypothetical protein